MVKKKEEVELSVYDQYVQLDHEISLIEEKKKVLREKIAAELPPEGYKDPRITAFWKESKKWTYPEEVVKLQEETTAKIEPMLDEVKAAKKQAEEDGTATVEITKQLNISVK